jgi:hypothetical protein
MKPEKELIWGKILMQSEYAGGILKKKLGCKKDYERLLEANENDKSFMEWFNELLNDGIIYPAGEIEVGMGKKVQGYRVDYELFEKRLRANKYWHLDWKFWDDRALVGASK